MQRFARLPTWLLQALPYDMAGAPATLAHGRAWIARARGDTPADEIPLLVMIYTLSSTVGAHGDLTASQRSLQARNDIVAAEPPTTTMETLHSNIRGGLKEMFVTNAFVHGAIPAGMETKFAETNSTSTWAIALGDGPLSEVVFRARCQQVMEAVRTRLSAALTAGRVHGNTKPYWAARWAVRAAEISQQLRACNRPLLFLACGLHYHLALPVLPPAGAAAAAALAAGAAGGQAAAALAADAAGGPATVGGATAASSVTPAIVVLTAACVGAGDAVGTAAGAAPLGKTFVRTAMDEVEQQLVREANAAEQEDAAALKAEVAGATATAAAHSAGATATASSPGCVLATFDDIDRGSGLSDADLMDAVTSAMSSAAVSDAASPSATSLPGLLNLALAAVPSMPADVAADAITALNDLLARMPASA